MLRSLLPILFLVFSYGSQAQQSKSVDFRTASGRLTFAHAEKKVSGTVRYTFDLLRQVDTVYLDARKMQVDSVRLNGKKVAFVLTDKQLKIVLPSKRKKKGNQLAFTYIASPRQALYFTGQGEGAQIWSQGQGKYTSNWFPSLDDTNDKMIFSLSFDVPDGQIGVSNGEQVGSRSGRRISFAMQKPMSSYLLMVAIGRFTCFRETSTSGVPMEFYLEPADSAKFEATYRYSRRIFDFFEREIGVPYPWNIYRQLPVQDFLYGGMENTTSTLFARDYVVDSIGWNDRDYTNVNAHELAHQWFGDLVTAASDDHHWLQEGFATYYALLAEREVFGDDYFQLRLYENAVQIERSKEQKPVVGAGASSLIYYQKGGWALHALRETIGEALFRKAVEAYLKKYQFWNVTTEQFLAEVERAAPAFDSAAYRRKWLDNPDFDMEEALRLLRKNSFMQRYFEVSGLEEQPFEAKKERFATLLAGNDYWPIKEEVVFQLTQMSFDEKKALLEAALATNVVHVRQAVARTMGKIPAEAYAMYASLLDDPSYITKEIVLNALCSQFPDKRKELLDKTRGVEGFSDKNLRILWLTLALKAKDYDPAGNGAYYDELLRYASPDYESNVRENALTNLLFLDPNDTNALEALARATVHHKWQFVKFSRDRIRNLIKKERYRTFFSELLAKLPDAERTAVENLLKESK